MPKKNSEILEEQFLEKLVNRIEKTTVIPSNLYGYYDVKRGLRDIDGKGVLTGLTNISTVLQNKEIDGNVVPADGRLYYRGINVNDLIKGALYDQRFAFEEATYLLLFGSLPTIEELKEFKDLLYNYTELPRNFLRDVIMKAPSKDIMNMMTKSILTLYSYDKNAEDVSVENVTKQCLRLIAIAPELMVYCYQAYRHLRLNGSLYIARPLPDKSTAENILYMLRPNGRYTPLEARVLDLALLLHAEHGGGNNSTFTMHVVTSTGTDTYSAVAAALCSLKGPKHGGANIKVREMFTDMKKHVKNWNDDEQISKYLKDLLDKKAFDKQGLIYGVGHAVYTLSDPRAVQLKEFVKKLSIEQGCEKEFKLMEKVEELAPKLISEGRNMYKEISVNVDFYSGFAYHMLGLPEELFTPLFAVARLTGWSAHRIEELMNGGKIIRPAYMSVMPEKEYVPLINR
ncbi:MAG: citrate/2-methylcitrate synthase [Clostridia bacterium]|nr:citrate/2-methylcitrate synthase [Clostridia bacterium]